jgi:mannosyltransferase OCH1-like enzyme
MEKYESIVKPVEKNVITIPKIVMQTWKNSDIPDKWKDGQKSVGKMFKGWKYVLTDDEFNRNFVVNHFPDYLKYYDAFPYNIQRVDVFRYMWLYVNGGVYIDMDNEIMEDFSYLFKEDVDLYFIKNTGQCIFTNWLMASKARVPFWLQILEETKRKVSKIGKHSIVMNTTGPSMLNKAIIKYKPNYLELPKNKFTSCNFCDSYPCFKEGTYLKQLEGLSWVGKDTKFYNFCYCHIWFISITLLTLLLLSPVIFQALNSLLKRNKK